jgi:hypothetical protein
MVINCRAKATQRAHWHMRVLLRLALSITVVCRIHHMFINQATQVARLTHMWLVLLLASREGQLVSTGFFRQIFDLTSFFRPNSSAGDPYGQPQSSKDGTTTYSTRAGFAEKPFFTTQPVGPRVEHWEPRRICPSPTATIFSRSSNWSSPLFHLKHAKFFYPPHQRYRCTLL